MLGSLALLRAISLQLDPAAYGVLALGLTGSLLVNQAINSGTTAAIARYYSPARDAAQLPDYLWASVQLLWGDQVVIAGLSAIAATVLALTMGQMWGLLALGAGCWALGNSCSAALSAVLNGGRHRLAAGAFMALDPWLKLLLLLLSWRLQPAGPAQILIIYGLSSGLFSLVAALALQPVLGLPLMAARHCGAAQIHPWRQQMRSFGRPFTRFGLTTWLQQASDRWALQLWAGSAAVGQYAVVYQLGFSTLGLLSNLINTVVGPILYQRSGEATSPERNQQVHRLIGRLTLLGLGLSGLAFAIAVTAHRWLFALLVAPSYQAFSIWLPWLVLAGSLFAVGQLIALKFMTDQRTIELGRVKTATALLGVLFNLVGAAFFGLAGVVVAQNLFCAIYLIWMIHLGLRAPLLSGPAHG